MQKSINELENRNKQKAENNQIQAMASLNRSAIIMQNSMENMMNSSSSGLGFEQFMQQMQNLAGQQAKLNQESLSFLQGQGNQGKLTIEEQSQIKRMLAEQTAIRNSMEQLYNDTGDRSDIIGNSFPDYNGVFLVFSRERNFIDGSWWCCYWKDQFLE